MTLMLKVVLDKNTPSLLFLLQKSLTISIYYKI
jgi:hypothetical protein